MGRVVASGAAALTASLLPAHDAHAVFRPGTYAGVTGIPVLFEAGASQVTNFRFGELPLQCSDGLASTIGGRSGTATARRIDRRRGRFSAATSPAPGAAVTVRGWLRGRRATGTVQIRLRLGADRRISPSGTIICRSPAVRWAARRSPTSRVPWIDEILGWGTDIDSAPGLPADLTPLGAPLTGCVNPFSIGVYYHYLDFPPGNELTARWSLQGERVPAPPGGTLRAGAGNARSALRSLTPLADGRYTVELRLGGTLLARVGVTRAC
jgi:hypothetical protein